MISFRSITHSKKFLLFFLATALLIIECAFFYVIPVSQRDPSYIANIQYSAPFTWTAPLTTGHTISQIFSINSNSFIGLDVYIATFARTNTATLVFDLFEFGNENFIIHKEISTHNFKDNEFYSLSVPFQPFSQNKKYVLVLTSPDGTENNAVALRYGHPPSMTDTTLMIDNQTIDSTLFIVPRYKTSTFAYLLNLSQRININKGGVFPLYTPFIVLAVFFFITNLFLISFTEIIHTALERFPHIAQMMRYLIVGGSAATIELITFLLLFYHGLWYLWANIIAFALAVIYAFFLQKLWTFQNYHRAYHIQAVKFLVITGIGFLLSNLLIFLFIDLFGWPPFTSKFLQLWLVLLWNYSGQKWWTFKCHAKN